MTWKTHALGGAQIGLVASYAASESSVESAVIISAAILGSLLPDIDKPGSKISRSDSLIGFISFWVSKLTRHRGFLHTVFGAAFFAALFYGLAVFRTEKESLLSFSMAFTVFILVHALGGVFSRLAGWLAAGAYVFGPELSRILSGSGMDFSVNKHTAGLCAAGIFLGCLSHMVYDSFNAGGIKWAYPLSKKSFSVLTIKTNSASEFWFFAVQVFLLAGVISVCYGESAAFMSAKSVFQSIERFVRSA